MNKLWWCIFQLILITFTFDIVAALSPGISTCDNEKYCSPFQTKIGKLKECEPMLSASKAVDAVSGRTATVNGYRDVAAWHKVLIDEAFVNYLSLTNQRDPMGIIGTAIIHSDMPEDFSFDDQLWLAISYCRNAIHMKKSMGTSNDDTSFFIKRAVQVLQLVQQTAYSKVCHGGIIWDAKKPYTNAITNSLYISALATVHHTIDELQMEDSFEISKEEMLKKMLEQLDWYKGSGMINDDMLINDGLDDDCKNNGQTEWTYNQSALLPGLALLSKITGKNEYAELAITFINAFIKKYKGDVIYEFCDEGNTCNADQNLFKGIYMQHLMYFIDYYPNAFEKIPELEEFIDKNYQSVVSTYKDRQFPQNWKDGSNLKYNALTNTAAIMMFNLASKYGKRKCN